MPGPGSEKQGARPKHTSPSSVPASPEFTLAEGEEGMIVPTLSIRLLGDFHVRYDHQPVTSLNTWRLLSLLAYLVLHRDAPQQRQHLAFLFWPDATEAQARNNLRQLLSTNCVKHFRRWITSLLPIHIRCTGIPSRLFTWMSLSLKWRLPKLT